MTAIEWLVKELEQKPKGSYLFSVIEQAKEMEKKQIEDAFKKGQESSYRLS
jgi:hypothetical protein